MRPLRHQHRLRLLANTGIPAHSAPAAADIILSHSSGSPVLDDAIVRLRWC